MSSRTKRPGNRDATCCGRIYFLRNFGLASPHEVKRVLTIRWKRTIPLLMLSVLTLSGCSAVTSTAHHALPKPARDDGMTLVWGIDVKQAALSLIAHSQHVCDLDIYELSDPDILNALAAAHARGVNVRVIVDATEKHSQSVAVPSLTAAGVPVVSLHIHHGISHIKMLITDYSVLMGGMNFGAASWGNNDASVTMAGPQANFQALFAWDWSRAHGQPSAAPAVTMPLVYDANIGVEMVNAITAARSKVKLEAFDLSDHSVLDALTAACARGVQVQVLLDPGQSYNRKPATELRDAGATVRFYAPYGGEWMHAKILDVDDGRIFLIGSANFSHQAYTYNHEGDLRLQDVGHFDAALTENLSAQIARGTDYPKAQKQTGW